MLRARYWARKACPYLARCAKTEEGGSLGAVVTMVEHRRWTSYETIIIKGLIPP